VASRAEQKALTRSALIDSWLRIIGSGTNFASVSQRQVAKTAGVVPTSFYRHFGDTEDLGLAVVDQLGMDLRRLMRGSFEPGESLDEIVHAFVGTYQEYVLDNADLVQFLNQARTGGTPSLREAIGNELEFFATRIAGALREVMPGLKAADRDTVAQLILAVLVENTTAVLARSARSEPAQSELSADLERKIQLILLGAAQLAAVKPTARKRTTRRRGAIA